MTVSRNARTQRAGWCALPPLASVLVSLLVACAPALAHHGKDFVLVESYELPEPRNLYLISAVERVAEDGSFSLVGSPAFLMGVAPRLAFELHTHFQRPDGERWAYAATAPGLHVQLTPPSSDSAWRLGASAEYEVAHRQDESSRIEARLVLAHRHEGRAFTFNLCSERERGGENGTAFGYALGFRPDLEARWGWGAEAQGEFVPGALHEILLGVYGEPIEKLTLKLGLGTSITGHERHLAAHAGIVLRLY